jgi:hypothetical protein
MPCIGGLEARVRLELWGMLLSLILGMPFRYFFFGRYGVRKGSRLTCGTVFRLGR